MKRIARNILVTSQKKFATLLVDKKSLLRLRNLAGISIQERRWLNGNEYSIETLSYKNLELEDILFQLL
jgi:hypothetical protein